MLELGSATPPAASDGATGQKQRNRTSQKLSCIVLVFAITYIDCVCISRDRAAAIGQAAPLVGMPGAGASRCSAR